MKNIYNQIYNDLSYQKRKEINNFIEDSSNLELNHEKIVEKYALRKNLFSPYLENRSLDKGVEIIISSYKIIFRTTTDFNNDYFFKVDFGFQFSDESYSTTFIICNKENHKEQLYVNFIQEKTDENFILEHFHNNLEIKLNSLHSNNNRRGIYVFKDNSITRIILEEYLRPEDFKDLMSLNYDIEIINDDILSNIYKHAIIIKDINKKSLTKKLEFK